MFSVCEARFGILVVIAGGLDFGGLRNREFSKSTSMARGGNSLTME